MIHIVVRHWMNRRQVCTEVISPLPHMPFLASSNSAANKDMMSKILTNVDAIF